MKFPSLVLVAVATALAVASGEEETKSNLRALSEQERDLQSAMDVLGRDECKDFVTRFSKQITDLVTKNSQDAVVAYHCNPIMKKKTKQTIKTLEKLKDKDESEIHPCFTATMKLILSNKKAVKKASKATLDCKAKMKKEYDDIQNLVEKKRDLQVGVGVAIAGAVAAGIGSICTLGATCATAAAGVATAGIGVAGTAVAGGVAIGKIEAKKKKHRVRQLNKLESALDFEDTEDTFELCKSEMYSLYMYVESDARHNLGHINMVAKPLDSNNEDCQEALVFDDYDVGERLITFLDDLDFAHDWHKDALPLGNFVLGDMKAAADSATVVQPNQYDIMTNNCATFVIEMLGHLKIPINAEVKHYTVNSLVKSSGLVEAIGGSESSEPSADKELMWNFVNQYVENHKLL